MALQCAVNILDSTMIPVPQLKMAFWLNSDIGQLKRTPDPELWIRFWLHGAGHWTIPELLFEGKGLIPASRQMPAIVLIDKVAPG
jgi:hypothetical protein